VGYPARGTSDFRGDSTLIRSGRGLAAVRCATSVSNEIAVHLVEADALPGPGWAELSSETHARLTVVLEEIGGRVEHRLKPHQAAPNGLFTMSFTPPGAPVWGYTDSIHRVRSLRLDVDLPRTSEALAEKLAMPSGPRLFDSDRLRHLAECLAAECDAADGFSSLYVDSLTTAACIDFLRLGPKDTARGAGRLAPWQLRRVTEYITGHLSETVRLKELAAITGLSQSQFGRAFKASTGFSPHRWQLNARIAKARELLLSSTLEQSEIALMTGFAEQSHFCRVFKALVGTPPATWQRRHRTRHGP
jgi:AraC family transcriptional regulator